MQRISAVRVGAAEKDVDKTGGRVYHVLHESQKGVGAEPNETKHLFCGAIAPYAFIG